MCITQLVTAPVAGGPWEGDGPPAFWPIFPIAWFLILMTAVFVGLLVVRRIRAEAPRRVGEARLAETYAAGEINAEEYRNRLSVLRDQ